MSHLKSRFELERLNASRTSVYLTPFLLVLVGLISMSVGTALGLSL